MFYNDDQNTNLYMFRNSWNLYDIFLSPFSIQISEFFIRYFCALISEIVMYSLKKVFKMHTRAFIIIT